MFEKIFIVAEAGSNHNGSLDTAVELVKRAKEADADAIKFQDFSLDSLFSPEYYEKSIGLKNSIWQKEIDMYTFKPEWHEIISEEAKKSDIIYFSTPFSLDAVNTLDRYVPFYKIASGDITFIPLLEKVSKKGKGVFISTGASYLEEIDNAIRILSQYNIPFICLMHCIMLYPAPPFSINLNFIDTLKERYNLPVGLSDHTLGIDASLLAVGKGIKAIEKHFTLNKNQQGSDHRNSLDPDEFALLVKKVRLYEKMLGKSERVISERESKERIYARRGIYAKKNLKKGERLTPEKVDLLRPNISVGAEKIKDLMNKILITDVRKGAPIEYSMVSENEFDKNV